MKPLVPRVLQGQTVRLEPMTLAHIPGLATVAFDPDLWQWTTTQLRTDDDLRAYVEEALALQRAGTAMLEYAFTELECLRVEFKTDALNLRSRGALEKLGARQEGILRSHMITSTGRRRDSLYFSILTEEWPEVRRALVERLAAPRPA
jgi:hypothetical protein